MVTFSEQLTLLIRAVCSAGLHLWEKAEMGSHITSSVKDDFSLVLNLDLESELILKNELQGTLPLVSEEDDSSHRIIGSDNDYFVIDPVDGTTSCKRFFSSVGGQIGFGPLGGIVSKGRLTGACFFNVPSRTLFVAERGVGSFFRRFERKENLQGEAKQLGLTKLWIEEAVPLHESAVLFYAGIDGELKVIEALKRRHLIENVYRFGGFANDATRLSLGYEQVQVQFAVKAWDLPAALITELSGLSVLVDPAGSAVPLSNWRVSKANPLIAASPKFLSQLLTIVKDAL